jgi:nicotinate-nucleotide adenylyltransferase
MSLTVFYGGTFDPVHNGHIAVAKHVQEIFAADIVWLPSARPPHRNAPGANSEQRTEMLRLALRDEYGMRVDDRECHRQGPSYTADTLREFRREAGDNAPLAWMIGEDAFTELNSWHEWRRLFDLANWIVVSRPGHALMELPADLDEQCAQRWVQYPFELKQLPAGKLMHVVGVERHESATLVRQIVAAGEDISAFVKPAVAEFIREQGLYRA